jgi:hypothetical protein
MMIWDVEAKSQPSKSVFLVGEIWIFEFIYDIKSILPININAMSDSETQSDKEEKKSKPEIGSSDSDTESDNEKSKEDLEKLREYRREASRKYRAEHGDVHAKAYAKRNNYLAQRTYYQKNREKILEKQRQKYHEKKNKIDAAKAEAAKEIRRAKNRKHQRDFRARKKENAEKSSKN